MSLWYRIQKALGIIPRERVIIRHEALVDLIQEIAQQENRPAEDVLQELVALGIDQRQSRDGYGRQWDSLSGREREVAALLCLGYTNPEIAAALQLSVSTVKTHVHNILRKFGLQSREELRSALATWDFESWLKHRPR